MLPEEVEEALFGVEGEAATYRIRRDGIYYVVYGETGSGRLLKMAAELLQNGQCRVFAAQDMSRREKRSFRGG